VIGIFGGTFDPVHYGHIKPALAIKQKLKLTQIRFVPNRAPPHRESPWLNVEQRLSLLTAALCDVPDVVIDRRELDRVGPSYMVDTVLSIKDDFPGERFVLIIGMDVFYDIAKWHRWKSLIDLCHIVVTTRPGFELNEVAKRMSTEDYQFLADNITDNTDALMQQDAGKILLQSVPQLDISATRIREMLLGGEDVSQWMPEQEYQELRGLIDDD
jgi:nicotinate-nucleotide adenylyltransferase